MSNRIAIPYPSWRFKKDIILLPNVLDKLEQINGVYYNWKVEEFPGENFADTKQIGVIAQEIEALFPELVITNADGYKAVDYPKLTAILIEAVKQQQAQITDYEQRIINNESRTTNNQQQIDELKSLIGAMANTDIND